MESIKELVYDICASLWLKPASIRQLKERDFCAHIAEYNIERILFQAEKKKLIYEKGGIWYCYKNTVVTKLNKENYQLE